MGFITDKYGQYKHPGKNTLIPNADGRITMKGINYPVLGIDDLGNHEVMMPGGEYQFPGNSVYEIPMIKKSFGGNVNVTGGSQVIDGQLCDAYGRPIDPARAKAADVNNNYRGPGMQHGGALPKAQGGIQIPTGIEGHEGGSLPYNIDERTYIIENSPARKDIISSNQNYIMKGIIERDNAKKLYQNGILFNIDWLNSPMAIEMMKKEDPENWRSLQQQRIAQLLRSDITVNHKAHPTKPNRYADASDEINVYPLGYKQWSTAIHEASHVSDYPLLSQSGESIVGSAQSYLDPLYNSFGYTPDFGSWIGYGNYTPEFFNEYTKYGKKQRLIPYSSIALMNKHLSNKDITKDQKEFEGFDHIDAFIADSIETYNTTNLLEVYETNDEFKEDFDSFQKTLKKDNNKSISTDDLKDALKLRIENKKEKEKDQDWTDYVSKHTEIRARLMAIRGLAKTQGIYDPFTEKVTPTILKELMEGIDQKDVNPIRQLLDIMTEEELMEELNKISNENIDPFQIEDDLDPTLRKAQDGLELDNQFVIPADNTRVVLPIQPFETNTVIEEDDVNDAEEVFETIEQNNELYKGLETVDINGSTYYVYTIQPNDNKSKVSDKFGLWNEQGILNSVNNKYGKSKDHDNYKLNNTRFWPGGTILVGGPEFESHVKYNNDRNNYINSFKDIPEDQLWSVISAIGHLETGSKVKYKKQNTYVEGVDIDSTGKAIPGGLYEYDNNPWTGVVESGMDDAYKFVSSANALGRFGIKEVHLDQYAEDILGYTDDDNWKQKYLKSKTDQQKLMQYLITDVYPKELSQLRHSYPKATSQYSDFQLLSALHRGGYGNVEEQLEDGQFSYAPTAGDISIGGYVDKAGGFLNPDIDISNQPFFSTDTKLHKPYLSKPSYQLGGSIGKLDPLIEKEVIGDMLENGAFLPKFKLGSEKTIKGALGKYKIKKNFDKELDLPYIQYTNSDNNIDNNRVYYDKDDVNGNDDFNIIDVYQQKEDKNNEHARLVMLINKYEQGEKLSSIELEYLRELDLVDEEVKTPKVVATPPMPSKNKFLLDIDVNKDIVNKNKSGDGIPLEAQIAIYQAYTNSLFEDKVDMRDYTTKLKRIYDKLNRVYYWESKASKMTVLDYMKSLNN